MFYFVKSRQIKRDGKHKVNKRNLKNVIDWGCATQTKKYSKMPKQKNETIDGTKLGKATTGKSNGTSRTPFRKYVYYRPNDLAHWNQKDFCDPHNGNAGCWMTSNDLSYLFDFESNKQKPIVTSLCWDEPSNIWSDELLRKFIHKSNTKWEEKSEENKTIRKKNALK